jgi:hypothetical protein
LVNYNQGEFKNLNLHVKYNKCVATHTQTHHGSIDPLNV